MVRTAQSYQSAGPAAHAPRLLRLPRFPDDAALQRRRAMVCPQDASDAVRRADRELRKIVSKQCTPDPAAQWQDGARHKLDLASGRVTSDPQGFSGCCPFRTSL